MLLPLVCCKNRRLFLALAGQAATARSSETLHLIRRRDLIGSLGYVTNMTKYIKIYIFLHGIKMTHKRIRRRASPLCAVNHVRTQWRDFTLRWMEQSRRWRFSERRVVPACPHVLKTRCVQWQMQDTLFLIIVHSIKHDLEKGCGALKAGRF